MALTTNQQKQFIDVEVKDVESAMESKGLFSVSKELSDRDMFDVLNAVPQIRAWAHRYDLPVEDDGPLVYLRRKDPRGIFSYHVAEIQEREQVLSHVTFGTIFYTLESGDVISCRDFGYSEGEYQWTLIEKRGE